jgi:hypothetical protein
VLLKENGLTHQRIQPHCPEVNGPIEWFYRAIREILEGKSRRTSWSPSG